MFVQSQPFPLLSMKALAAATLALSPNIALAETTALDAVFDLAASETVGGAAEGATRYVSVQSRQSDAQQAQPSDRAPASAQSSGGAPSFQMPKIVFDETWASVGIGVGFVPSYSGSDDYVAFPLPLIVGRVGGVGISPNGPGFVLDFNSPKPSLAPPEGRFSFGPAFRIRNDRVAQIEDQVVEQLEDLDLAIELGGNIGYSFPSVFKNRDALTLSTQVRWDVAGAHDGMLIEPSIGYRTLIGKATVFQISANAQFVDDSFADYYYTVTPTQSTASGLPVFNADGGLNSVGATAILNFDLDGNAINGGLNAYTVLGYSRLVGDGADTPFTSIRGSANQFIAGVGIGYTF